MTEIRVKVADCAVGRDDQTLITIGLGSCVAIVLYDAAARIGGLAHTLLPDESMARDRSNPAKFAASAGFFAPGVAIAFHRRRRLRRFDAQLTEALQQMANALRAGLTLQQAIDQVGRDAAAPLRQEFGLFTREIKLGAPLDDALLAMAGRVGSICITVSAAQRISGSTASNQPKLRVLM